jgi:membrane fusion protein (multidrug efflux system)
VQKRMKIMLIATGILFGTVFLYKAIITLVMKHAMSKQPHVSPVSVMTVGFSSWQPRLTASGSLRAVRGVDVTTEVAGMVKDILFTPGAWVKKGNLLVQLINDNDLALLQSFEADEALAKITYERDKKQFVIHAISQQTLDIDIAKLKNSSAQVAQQRAMVEKKSIRAPFDGRLGINQINPGQYLKPGDKIVNLQTFNPIYVDFYVPQQSLGKLKVGESVHLTTSTFSGHFYSGELTTIEPAVNDISRNVKVEATIDNKGLELSPGMFVSVDVIVGKPEKLLTVPQTAISFNPYGNVVFIVHESKIPPNEKPTLTVAQHFVTTGEARGEQITVVKGLKEGDRIVTSGQLKIKNGSEVEVNNSISPSNNPNPTLDNNHR